MVFIRVKKVKDIDYLYLVQSKWNPHKKISTQITIKYLGKAANVTVEDIPLEYKNNPQILSTLNLKTSIHSKRIPEENLKDRVLDKLKNGNVEEILEIYENYKTEFGLLKFYDNVLKPVLYEIGLLWEQNKLDIASEHICSNTINETIHRINEFQIKNKKKDNVLLCTPDGEIHNIACNIIGSVLLHKGYNVHNISPSAPTESIIKYIKETSPSIIMISVTLKDNIESCKRLIKKINSELNSPILLGGLAITESNELQKKQILNLGTNIKIAINISLDKIIRIVKNMSTINTISNKIIENDF
ncbi:MAG TPA: cobalamin-dependent protein [Candidatus Nitrosocosmicus sp.]